MKDYETEMKQICINLRKLMQNMKQEDILEQNLKAPLLTQEPTPISKTIIQSLFMHQSYISIATPPLLFSTSCLWCSYIRIEYQESQNLKMAWFGRDY